MIIKRKKGGKKWDLKSEKWISPPPPSLSPYLLSFLPYCKEIELSFVTLLLLILQICFLLFIYYRSIIEVGSGFKFRHPWRGKEEKIKGAGRDNITWDADDACGCFPSFIFVCYCASLFVGPHHPPCHVMMMMPLSLSLSPSLSLSLPLIY
jgi:hypothetical protein